MSVRLDGRPARLVSGGDFFITRQDLRLLCDEGVQSFVYRQGTGSYNFSWTPRCQEVSLRVWVRSPEGLERELTPAQEWRGPLSFPNLLKRGRQGDIVRWDLDFGGVKVAVEYRVRTGGSIQKVAHRAPPMSLRN